jgi:hypothetical protein
MSQLEMAAALRRPSSGELYLWGYYVHGKKDCFCWSIGVDENTGEPFVNKYHDLNNRISKTGAFFWLNSIMRTRIQGRLETIGDVVIDAEVSNQTVMPSDLAFCDITGSGDGTSHIVGDDNFVPTDIRDLLETNNTQWNFNTLGSGPFGGNNPQQGNGSFEYYGVTGDDPTGSVVKPEHRGLQNSYMYQNNQTVDIQSHEYFVVYEISNVVTNGYAPFGIAGSYLSKVFLCRKKQ